MNISWQIKLVKGNSIFFYLKSYICGLGAVHNLSNTKIWVFSSLLCYGICEVFLYNRNKSQTPPALHNVWTVSFEMKKKLSIQYMEKYYFFEYQIKFSLCFIMVDGPSDSQNDNLTKVRSQSKKQKLLN